MNEFINYAETIKSVVTMQRAIALYAPSPAPRHNRIPCPIHNGDKYNLHYSDKLYHCFVCGEGGDVISFVRHIFKLDFVGAVRKLNADFALNLPLDRKPTLREQREAEQRQRELSAERAKAEAEKQAYDTLYNALWDEFARLDKQRRAYKPLSAEDEINPLYVEAVSNISNVCYRIDTLL
jgi:DNA primase